METPLIYTIKGNLPEADLEYSKKWEFIGKAIKFTETYKLNDEVVKESSHVFVWEGMDIATLQGTF